MRRVPRSSLRGHSAEVAPQLLNKVLLVDHGGGDRRWGRIIEVEAYGGPADPASHAFRGLTPRNEPMFGRAGTVYVYFSYGMHWCANIVVGAVGDPVAVLLRAIVPMGGLDAIRAARPRARRDADLANGPAKLCQSLGIDATLNGADLFAPSGCIPAIRLLDDGTAPPEHPLVGPRVGISVAKETLWRFRTP